MLKLTNYAIVAGLIFITSFLKQDGALAGGGFSSSCPQRTLVGGVSPSLLAQCFNDRRKLVGTSFLLDRHIANDNGHFAWRRGGNFSNSTRGCYLETRPSSTILHCRLKARDGSYRSASLNLDRRIANYNGHLRLSN